MRNAARHLCLVLMLVLAAPAIAAVIDEPGIHSAIDRQLDAFNRNDAAAAFALASPTVQARFGDAAKFMAMVQQLFPQVRHSRSHRFINIDAAGGKVVQRVLVESEAGIVVARYEMVQINGEWRLNGCTLEKRPGT